MRPETLNSDPPTSVGSADEVPSEPAVRAGGGGGCDEGEGLKGFKDRASGVLGVHIFRSLG